MLLLPPSLLGCLALLTALSTTAPTWPAAIDELEDVMFLNTGYKSRGFSSHITPCSFSEFGAGRQTAAEWLRIGFHDMATANVFFEPYGGLDGSIAFELQPNGENIGPGFVTSLNTYSNHFNSRLSIADMIALGVYASVRGCGGPVVPMRGGRVDVTAKGPIGVPQPQNGQGSFVNQFARMGFSIPDMVQMTACGHAIGGVHAANFPEIVTAGTAPNDYQLFDTTLEFDNKIAVQYVNGPISDPLTVGPSVRNTRNSDFAVFTADRNVTIKAMTDAQVFNNVCSAILGRMIDTVPPSVILSDVITPYEVKPSGIQLTLLAGGNDIRFSGDIRVRTTTRTVSSVTITYKDRNGGNGGTITTTLGGSASGFDDRFAFFSFSSNIPASSSISSFTVAVAETGGLTTTFSNNGGGFPIQDTVIVQSSQSCLSNGNLTVVAAVRSTSTTPVNLIITQKVPRSSDIPIPALVNSTVVMTKGATVGLFDLYSASATISSAAGTKFGVSNGAFADDFKDTSGLGATCLSIDAPVPTSTSSTSIATPSSSRSSIIGTSTSSSATPVPTLARKPTVGAYTFQGCYTEGAGARALTGASLYNYPSMTLESCSSSCVGFTYFGVEYGGECYCGNVLDATSTLAPLGDCGFTCPGNQYEYCGAGNRLELYKLTSMVASTSSSTLSTKFSSTSLSSSISTSSPAQTSSVISSTKSPSTISGSSSATAASSSSSNPPSVSQSITTAISSTIPTTPTPSPTLHIVPSVGLYNYAGCYTEPSSVRALSSAFYPTDSQTVELCVAACSNTPYKYAGLEYSRECWCADSFGLGSTLVSDNDCSMSCAGDKYEYCGGGNRLSVYIRNGTDVKGSSSSSPTSSSSALPILPSSSSPSPAPSSQIPSIPSSAPANPIQTAPAIKSTISLPTSDNTTFTYLSCYTEAPSTRTLNQAAFYNYTSMTLEMCAQNCGGFKYWGTEYGGECYCGNTLSTGSSPVRDEECGFVCPGDKLEFCGAGNRLSVYSKV
ncbi:hypothetical protein HYFRA_00012731 [Hymenoscyphus fraxineus]|uniref:Heme peroxidase n=1 Tax=Hymenoscyphus fraxineus TaxID=746836 RepID=A0A9N9L8W7_9HELO|nr:hypothetical protein HYFRA_00012731 [Hymenoscyphus fraxineus]